MAPALFILGCAGFTLYPVAMSWACEKAMPHELVAMNQALVDELHHRQPVGPVDDGAADAKLFRPMLFVMIAAVALVYLMMLLRKQKPDRHHTPFAAA